PPSSPVAQRMRYTGHIDPLDGPCSQTQRQNPRYSYHIRSKPATKYPRPDVMVQYKRKKPKKRSDNPQVPASPPKTKTPIKAKLDAEANKMKHLNAMAFEHPTVTLDIGTLAANVKKAPAKQALVAEIIRGAVQEASKIKRRCQELIGRYLEKLDVDDDGRPKDEWDKGFLVYFCPP
ncbi:hypothetical protein DFQ26_002154, partial [Actinomortierella ambigua]